MKECNRCILTEKDDNNLVIDENGDCNYCNSYDFQISKLGDTTSKKLFLDNKIKEVKSHGKGRKYDCIIGLSGGLDSSYMAYWLCKIGIRPLVVHLDNGWNSELAVKNIQNICEKLNLDLHTHVIDWEEFRDLQIAYLKASVVDIEVLTDHAIKAVMNKMAKKYNIKYSFSGFNLASEAIMINGWTFDKTDFSNIKDIAWKFGRINKFLTYPKLTFWNKLFNKLTFNLETIHLLNYIDYNIMDAKLVLKNELNWVEYGGKHQESLFTKFYQFYILPNKFNIDKRKVHLSNLICSNQITKNEAKRIIKLPLQSEEESIFEKNYVLKKLNLTNEDFNEIMNLKINNHQDFETEDRYWKIYFKFVKILKLKIFK